MAPLTRRIPDLLKLLAGTCGLWACVAPNTAYAAHKGRPDVSVALKPLGFGAIAGAYLQAGQTMYTLNFVDNSHLLLTFNTNGLLARLRDAEPGDEDRNVAALLLELPSGKVVARTTWRTRDHGRYLWALGHGRFLLRSRNRFSVVDPLRNLGAGDAFRTQDLVQLKRRVVLVDVSADGRLLMVETAPPAPPPLIGAAASAAALAATVPQAPKPKPTLHSGSAPPYLLHFYRLKPFADGGQERLVAQDAGRVGSLQPAELAMTPLGYLGVVKESGQVYDFDFYSYSGKKLELSPYDTSCPPHAVFTSTSDFVAFGCRGGVERNEISGFNLRGEEPWVSVLPGSQAATFLMNAPAAGRFALSVMTNPPASAPGMVNDTPQLATQQVEVRQHHDGRVLLKVPTGPVQLAGQNFDLSPDGLLFAAVQVDQIGVYRLPPLSHADEKAMAVSAAAFQEAADGPVRLQVATMTADGGRVEEIKPDSVAAGPGQTANAPAAGAADAATPAAAASSGEQTPTVQNGDAPSGDAPLEGHRKPPTLYDPEHPKPENP